MALRKWRFAWVRTGWYLQLQEVWRRLLARWWLDGAVLRAETRVAEFMLLSCMVEEMQGSSPRALAVRAGGALDDIAPRIRLTCVAQKKKKYTLCIFIIY